MEDLARIIANAERVIFFTGAGISAESGLPTYRGVGGLYNDMAVDEGLPIEEILSGSMFARRPELTWKYIAEIERACRGAMANDAHRAIAALEQYAEVHVVTQNVDGFHADAGSSNLIELHGNLHKLYCLSCDAQQTVSSYEHLHIPPYCEYCLGLVRPRVVLFEEMLPLDECRRMDLELAKGFDVYFAVGTTAGFPYIYEPIVRATHRGKTTIEINPGLTPLSEIVTHRFAATSGTTLEALLRACDEA